MDIEELVKYISKEMSIVLKKTPNSKGSYGALPDIGIEILVRPAGIDGLFLEKTHMKGEKECVCIENNDRTTLSYFTFSIELALLRFYKVQDPDPLLTTINRAVHQSIKVRCKQDYSPIIITSHIYPNLKSAMSFIEFIVNGFKEPPYSEIVSGIN